MPSLRRQGGVSGEVNSVEDLLFPQRANDLGNLGRQIRKMDEAGPYRAGFGNSQHAVEGGIAEEISGTARKARRDPCLEQPMLDVLERQARQARRRAGRLDRAGRDAPLVVRDLEVIDVRSEPLEPYDRFPRPQTQANDHPWRMTLDQILEAAPQARIVHRQDGADNGAAPDALAIERIGDLSGGIDATSSVAGKSDNQHVKTS
jgi:hypothetical protein